MGAAESYIGIGRLRIRDIKILAGMRMVNKRELESKINGSEK